MKLLAFLPLLLIALSSGSMSPPPGESPDRMPDFYVSKTEKDPSLDANHARFVIHFNFWNNSDYKALPLPTIELSCNGVIRTVVMDSTQTYSIEVSPGKYTFMLSAGPQYYEVFSREVSIEGGMVANANCSFRTIQRGEEIRVYKPVIYTYSDKNESISLELQPKGAFTFTYPAYQDHWSGTAHADGSFTTKGKTYPYLFWEGTSTGLTEQPDFSEGFIVKKEEVIAFLEEQLTQIGFNDRERTDFITFWGPRMTQSELGFVRFLVNEDYAKQVAALNVSPKPEHMYRLYLLWTPLDEIPSVTPNPQKLPPLQRGGLTIVEWGGSEIPAKKES